MALDHVQISPGTRQEPAPIFEALAGDRRAQLLGNDVRRCDESHESDRSGTVVSGGRSVVSGQ